MAIEKETDDGKKVVAMSARATARDAEQESATTVAPDSARSDTDTTVIVPLNAKCIHFEQIAREIDRYDLEMAFEGAMGTEINERELEERRAQFEKDMMNAFNAREQQLKANPPHAKWAKPGEGASEEEIRRYNQHQKNYKKLCRKVLDEQCRYGLNREPLFGCSMLPTPVVWCWCHRWYCPLFQKAPPFLNKAPRLCVWCAVKRYTWNYSYPSFLTGCCCVLTPVVSWMSVPCCYACMDREVRCTACDALIIDDLVSCQYCCVMGLMEYKGKKLPSKMAELVMKDGRHMQTYCPRDSCGPPCSYCISCKWLKKVVHRYFSDMYFVFPAWICAGDACYRWYNYCALCCAGERSEANMVKKMERG